MKKLLPLLLILALLLCGCVRQPAATEPPETDPPATAAPTAPPETTSPETNPAETEPPETTPPSEPTSVDDDDYNLVFYLRPIEDELELVFFIASEQSDVWIPLDNPVYSSSTRTTAHGQAAGIYKYQCYYPGELSDTWRLLVIRNKRAQSNTETSMYFPQDDIEGVYEFDGIVIKDKNTLLVQRAGGANGSSDFSHTVFDTMPMVFCEDCPEEWRTQWDGEVVSAKDGQRFYGETGTLMQSSLAEAEPPVLPASDGNYNLVFYFYRMMGSPGPVFYLASEDSNVWIPLDGNPNIRNTTHEHTTGYLCKCQYSYPGEITGSWRLLVLDLYTLLGPEESYPPEMAARMHDPHARVEGVYEYRDIVIQDKTTLIAERMRPSDYDYQPLYEHIVFDAMPMVFCDICPEEWLAQWDGEVVSAKEAPFYEDWGDS